MSELIYGGKRFSEFKTYYDGSLSFQSGDKEYDFFAVPGRSGDLTVFKNRFSNKTIPIPCFIRENFAANFSELKSFLYSLNGYQRLELSQDPNHFREAVFTGGITPETTPLNWGGKFTIDFYCKPQRYLKSGETPLHVDADDTLLIMNPTRFGAYPIIKVTGTGTFTVGGVLFTLSENTSVVTVDFERQDAYEEGGLVNRNGDLSMSETDFPTIPAGLSAITTTGCSIDVYPRWYTL